MVVELIDQGMSIMALMLTGTAKVLVGIMTLIKGPSGGPGLYLLRRLLRSLHPSRYLEVRRGLNLKRMAVKVKIQSWVAKEDLPRGKGLVPLQ